MDENQVSTPVAEGDAAKKQNMPLVIGAGVIVLLLIGFVLFRNSDKEEKAMDVKDDSGVTSLPTPQKSMSEPVGGAVKQESMTTAGEVKTIAVEGGSFYFKPSEIRVKKGEKIKVTLTSKDMVHDFVVDELGVRTPIIKAGDTGTVEFTATQVGTFEYYCSVGQHRAKGMVGKLIVE